MLPHSSDSRLPTPDLPRPPSANRGVRPGPLVPQTLARAPRAVPSRRSDTARASERRSDTAVFKPARNKDNIVRVTHRFALSSLHPKQDATLLGASRVATPSCCGFFPPATFENGRCFWPALALLDSVIGRVLKMQTSKTTPFHFCPDMSCSVWRSGHVLLLQSLSAKDMPHPPLTLMSRIPRHALSLSLSFFLFAIPIPALTSYSSQAIL